MDKSLYLPAKTLERKDKIASLSALYRKWSGSDPGIIVSLPPTASGREYFRLSDGRQPAVGVWSENRRENDAFIAFTSRFRSEGLPVPEIYLTDTDNHVYLLQDLGDLTFHRLVLDHPDPWSTGSGITGIYQKVIGHLTAFQQSGLTDDDYALCVPRPDFDSQSILWDLNYFKYFCLRLLKVGFDEQALEDDFHRLAGYLSSAGDRFFMYRDFQSRNIMLSMVSRILLTTREDGAVPCIMTWRPCCSSHR